MEEFDRERAASSGCEWRPWREEAEGPGAPPPPKMEGALVAIDPPTGQARPAGGGLRPYSPYR